MKLSPESVLATASFNHPRNLHIGVLDGLRGISILLVLTAHMLPFGTHARSVNQAVGAAGMAIFFTLSGLLITRSLLADARPAPFLVKRLFRILPLVFLFVALYIAPQQPGWRYIVANVAFYANSSESYLTLAPHLWSLSLEMQFYAFAAAMTLVFGGRWLRPIPVLALTLAVTAGRIWHHTVVGIGTFDRIDEILVGASLAVLIHAGWLTQCRWANRWTLGLLFTLLLGCTDIAVRTYLPILAYARPYLAATLVGALLLSAPVPGLGFMTGPVLRYTARVSFALYVIHRVTYMGWMGTGDVVARYAKRAFALLLTFILAHLSTTYFESPITAYGHRLAKRFGKARPAAHAA